MAVHFYFVPVIFNATPGPSGGRGPKYINWGANQGIVCSWNMIDEGHINVCFLAADVNLADHQLLFDQADVLSIDQRNGSSRDLDANATQAEIDALTGYLDNGTYFCPLGWANTSMTRREILRGIVSQFLFIQRITGITEGGTPLDWGITLATTWAELTQDQRNILTEAATSRGYEVDAVNNSTTMRQILRYVAVQRIDRQVFIGIAVL